MVQSIKTRLVKFSLLALIFAFFAIPLTMVCLFECRYIVPKKVASVLLFFFR